MVRSAFSRFVCISCCLVVFFLSLSAAQAQCTGKILGHTDLGALVCVDPGTAAVTSLGTAGPIIMFKRLSALDAAGQRYFFADDSFNLYVFNTVTGSKIAGPLSMPLLFLAGMKFDSSSGTLFGHAYLGSSFSGPVTLVIIDTATGSVTPKGTVPISGSVAVQPWIAALDSAGHRYFFVDSTPTLYVLNTQTGAQIGPALPLSMPLAPTAMEFDPSTGLLYCHTFLGTAETLLSINPATGNVLSVGAWTNPGSLCPPDGVAALNSASHTYFFPDCTSALDQINTQTGLAVVAPPALSPPVFLMGMEFASNSAPPPPPPDPSPYKAQVQPPLNPDGPSTFSTSRGSVPVKFTLTHNGAATCNLPAATISLVLQGGTPVAVDPASYWMASDDGANFRNSGCQYVYNLGSGGLRPGTYEVDITIAGSSTPAGKATFTLGK